MFFQKIITLNRANTVQTLFIIQSLKTENLIPNLYLSIYLFNCVKCIEANWIHSLFMRMNTNRILDC